MSDISLADQSVRIRKLVLQMLANAGSGHSAGALGSADILATLFFGDILKIYPNDPYNNNRDRFLLSCGHYAPGLYATLALARFFPVEELETLRKLGSRLQGHPVRQMVLNGSNYQQLPGVENSGGPLGQGLSESVGMALAAKMNKEKWQVVCLSSDAEQQEGQSWEAYMTAVKYKLGNLTFIVDKNDIQISGMVSNVMPAEQLKERYSSFGMQSWEIDGHNYEQIKEIFVRGKLYPDKPKIIIAKTTAGKGVSFMEGNYKWHGDPPSIEQARQAIAELPTVELEKNLINF